MRKRKSLNCSRKEARFFFKPHETIAICISNFNLESEKRQQFHNMRPFYTVSNHHHKKSTRKRKKK